MRLKKLLLLLFLLSPSGLFSQGFTFRTIPHANDEDPTDSNSDEGTAINNYGTVVFLHRPAGGNVRTLKVFPTGAVLVKTPPDANSVGINAQNTIGGTCFVGGRVVGFIARQNGVTFTYAIPGKVITGGGAVNDYEHKVVSVRDSITNQFSGVLRDHLGRNTVLDYPGAVFTDAEGINNSDDVVGIWGNGFTDHGYLYSKGKFYRINVPDSIATIATGINNKGQIAGGFVDEENVQHGYIFTETSRDDTNVNGTFATIDFPIPGLLTANINGINDKGKLVGSFLISNPAMVNGLERFVFITTPN